MEYTISISYTVELKHFFSDFRCWSAGQIRDLHMKKVVSFPTKGLLGKGCFSNCKLPNKFSQNVLGSFNFFLRFVIVFVNVLLNTDTDTMRKHPV